MTAALYGLAIAFLLDVCLGDPPNSAHPVVAMGSFIRFVTRKFNTGSDRCRLWSGTLLIISGVLLFSLPFTFLQWYMATAPVWVQSIVTGIFLKVTFSFRRLLTVANQIRTEINKPDLIEARRLTAWHLVSRDTSQLSRGHIISAVIESLSENLTDSLLAPLLFFAVGGLPLAWAYRFVNTADAMIGYRNEEFEFFGKTAARLDDALNWIPARIAGLLLVVSARLTGLNAGNAYNTMKDQHTQTASPNAGWTMSAAAGALGVILEKHGNYRLSGGSSLPIELDIHRSIRLVSTAMVLSLLLCGGIILVIQSLS